MKISGFTPPLTKTQRDKARRDFTKKLGVRIREVRKEKGLTQQKLAEEADLHLTYVAHLENGKYHPTVFVLWKIVRALGVSMNDLVKS